MTGAYYNENDPYAAQWLRNLIDKGHIAAGFVDDRSIHDIEPGDLAGYTQLHFFAGIGVWSYALRAAGWPDDRPIWTGSCPCQPFSGAGKREGVDDPRHLWPVWFKLIREYRPGVVLGEQVASRDGLGWWDIVSDDLESEAYAAAAIDLCVPGVGAPHIRQRLYWMADATSARHVRTVENAETKARDETRLLMPGAERGLGGLADASDAGHERRRSSEARNGRNPPRFESERFCDAVGMADAMRTGRPQGRTGTGNGPLTGCGPARGMADADPCGRSRHSGTQDGPSGNPEIRTAEHSGLIRLAYTHGRNAGTERQQRSGEHGQQPEDCGACGLGNADSHERTQSATPCRGRDNQGDRPEHASVLVRTSPLNGFWRDADWLFCTDGKWRPVEPGSFPLAHGVADRVGKLRAYGNAIVAPQAIQFIKAVMHEPAR